MALHALHRRRLSRAVRADQAEDLALEHVERDVVDGHGPAVALAEMGDRDDWPGLTHGGGRGYLLGDDDGPADNLAASERLVGGVGVVERETPGDDRLRAERAASGQPDDLRHVGAGPGPYEPMIRSPRRTSRVISTGAVVLPGAMPTATIRPPSPMISSAWMNVSGRPSTSNATSTPRPSVSSRTRSVAFVVRRVDDVGRPDATGDLELVVAHVDRDDLRRAERARDLDDVQPDAAGRDHRHAFAATEIGAVADGAIRREHRTSENRGFGQRQAGRQRKDVGRRHDRVLARPAIEYIASGVPSARRSRVVPS